MPQVGKTSLFRALARALRGQDTSAPRSGPTRREILKGSLAAAALAACGDNAPAPPGPGPTVAIIGGGVAGLHAAWQLKQHGVIATVYEASMRTGGRMYTASGKFPNGQVCELGGELIDTAHTTLMSLAATFGLQLDDLHGEEQALGLASDTFLFGGTYLTESDLVAWFTPVAQKMSAAVTAGAADATEFARIDNLSIPAWLEQEAGLPPTDVFRRLLELAYLGEYGREVSEQSAWNLIYLMDYANPDPFAIFGSSDEAFHLHQGSQSVPDALAGALDPDQIALDHKLVAASTGAGDYSLVFDTSGGPVHVTADHVIFALPFTTLRKVDLSLLILPPDKRAVIETLGYGSNAKLMSGYTTRVWRDHGSSGTAITDVGQLQATWDTSRGQTGPTGLLVDFVGGARGLSIGEGTAEDQMTMALPWIERLFPNTAAAYVPGSALRQHWPSYPFNLASYACYLPGQWEIQGTEGARVGNLHFCGEHCSIDFQGYMEGGAETGAMAAGEVLDDLGIAHSAMLRGMLAHKLRLWQASYHAARGARLVGPSRWLARRRLGAATVR
jgi:monoamine oxidase